MPATPGSGRLALALAALALLFGLACAAPASAQYYFTPRPGFSSITGAPVVTFEVIPYLFLPNVRRQKINDALGSAKRKHP